MGSSLKWKKIQDAERSWNTFIKLGLKTASTITSAAVVAKTNNPQADQATSKFKKIKGGKIIS